MKINEDLIKLLLIEVEGEEVPDLTQYSKDQILYHKNKLLEKGWASGKPLRGDDKIVAVMLTDLLPSGHEALEVMRDDTKWKKVKDGIQQHGGTLTLALLQTLITQLTSGAIS